MALAVEGCNAAMVRETLVVEVRAETARRRALGPFVVGWWKATLRNKTGVVRETENRPAIYIDRLVGLKRHDWSCGFPKTRRRDEVIVNDVVTR